MVSVTSLLGSPNVFYGLVADGIFKTQEEVDNHAEQPGKLISLKVLILKG